MFGAITKAAPGFKLGFAESGGGAAWYYARGAEQVGPVGLDEIRRLIQNKAITGGTLVWKSGLPAWSPLEQTELGAYLGQSAGQGQGVTLGKPGSPPWPGPPPPYGGQPAGPPYGQPGTPPYGGYPGYPPQAGAKGGAMAYFKHACSNIFLFKTRASRAEYWWTTLFASIIMLVAVIIFIMIAVGLRSDEALIIMNILIYLLALGFGVCTIGLVIRRFHDVGLSGWLYLLGFIPILGGIFVLIVALLPSKGPNQYGYGPWRP
jgi:uncharacterized membrane protein YhaH (DUF805 family)